MENEDKNTISADKAILHLTFAGRRLLIAFVVMCVAFVAAIVFFTEANTRREQNILEMFSKLHPAMTEVENGQNGN